MATKVSATSFVNFLVNRYLAKDGYIMGATGQNPKKWATTSWWFTQYSGKQKEKALYWRDHAKRVWDCNGMAEGYYKDVTGIDINTKARYNYANWCGKKGTGNVPNKHKVPGLAVFKGTTASKITHVGYLVCPVDKSNPDGDWYVVEAKGVKYGVVKTKLNSGKWNFWGYMTKYFDYSGTTENVVTDSMTTEELGYRTLKKGDKGADVKELQKLLLAWNSKCLPKYGADSDFGDETETAVKAFQKANNLTVDGIVGKQTYAALLNEKEDEEEKEEVKVEESAPSKPKVVVVSGGKVNIRSANNTKAKILLVGKQGQKYDYLTTSDNWHQIVTEKGNGWISGKYSKVTEE